MEFIGIVPSDNRVIMKILASSLEDQSQPTSKPLRLSKALLRRVSCYTLHSNLMDSCLYVLSRWILELLESKEDSFVRCAGHSYGATASACRGGKSDCYACVCGGQLGSGSGALRDPATVQGAGRPG